MATKKKSKFRMLRNDIMFQFESEDAVLRDGKKTMRGFKEVTDWGFTIVSPKESASQPRWGVVVAVGPDVDTNDIAVGRRILIENLKWTEGVKVDGEEYWKTNSDVVLGVDSAEDK